MHKLILSQKTYKTQIVHHLPKIGYCHFEFSVNGYAIKVS